MDLKLFLRVIWRFKYLVGAGLAIGIALAVLSYGQTAGQERYQSNSTIFVTQQGFPWGRVSIPEANPQAAVNNTAPTTAAQFADPSRLTSLATLYAQLAVSDQVRAVVIKNNGGPLGEDELISATPISGGTNNDQGLPLVQVTTTAKTAERTLALTALVTKSFNEFLTAQQAGSDIPADQRVITQVVKEPGGEVPGVAIQTQGRSLTRPLVLFLALVIVSVGLAFILENLRPRSAGGHRSEVVPPLDYDDDDYDDDDEGAARRGGRLADWQSSRR